MCEARTVNPDRWRCLLDVLIAKSLIDQTTAMKGKEMLIEIVSMRVLCLLRAVNVVKA